MTQIVNVDVLYPRICIDLLNIHIYELNENFSKKYFEQNRNCIGIVIPDNVSANARFNKNIFAVPNGKFLIAD